VILKVDGEDASRRIAERLKYTAHSTLQAGMYVAGERSLVRGPRDSTATFTVRDLHDQVRELRVARKAEYLPQTQGDRTGDVLRMLPGNIGYADLDRLPSSRVDEMFEKFKDCPAIIFDDRGYPQGTAWQIAPRLTEKADVVARCSSDATRCRRTCPTENWPVLKYWKHSSNACRAPTSGVIAAGP